MNREPIDELKRQITADNLTNRQVWDMAGDAVSEENLDLISALWELGINFTDNPYHCDSPMSSACSGHLDVVKHLVGLGVDPAGSSVNLRPYTVEAAEDNQWEIVWFLLEHGADINALDLSYGRSLLGIACREYNLDVVTHLLDLGADPMRVGECEYSYWGERHCLPEEEVFCVFDQCLWAFKSRYDTPVLFNDILAALLDHVTPDQRDADELMAIHLLVKLGSEEGVSYLLEKGWDINARSEQGYSPLHIAVLYNPPMLSFLLQCGADPQATNESGETPFQIANMLPFDYRDRYRAQREQITLSHADEYPYPYPFDVPPAITSDELVQWRDVQASDGTTMLHHAVMKSDTELVHRLLQAGFNPNLANHRGFNPFLNYSRGYTPLEMAYQVSSPIELIKDLLAAGSKPEMPSHHGYHLQGNVDKYKCLLELLLKHGADINELDDCGYTAWHHLLNTETAEILLNCSGDPCLHGEGADPPVIYYASNGDWEIVRFLIEHCADPLSRDCEGKSLLHFPKHLTEEMAQMLLDAGVDINGQDQYGMTPLVYMAIADFATIDDWLYQHGADVTIIDSSGRNACDWASYVMYRDDYLNELSGETVDEEDEE